MHCPSTRRRIQFLAFPCRRLAPLWDTLHPSGTGDHIYVDTSVSGQVKIRWDATNEADGSDVNFSVTLFSTGLFRFDGQDLTCKKPVGQCLCRLLSHLPGSQGAGPL